MDPSTSRGGTELLPTQSAAIARGELYAGAPGEGPGGLPSDGGVVASQSVCDGLHGPAKSLCYAAVYGVSV